MLTRRFIWLSATAICIIGTFAGGHSGNGTENMIEKRKEVIERYISQSRGWTPASYTVRFRERAGNTEIFWITRDVAGSSVRPIPGGDGNSFEVLIDARTGNIKGELAFQ